VYAAWVSARSLDPEMLARFNTALSVGLDHLPELIKILPTIPGFDLDEYYRENISYELTEPKWVALNRFLQMLAGEKGYHLQRQSVAAPTY
jgi:chorismate dehydratase